MIRGDPLWLVHTSHGMLLLANGKFVDVWLVFPCELLEVHTLPSIYILDYLELRLMCGRCRRGCLWLYYKTKHLKTILLKKDMKTLALRETYFESLWAFSLCSNYSIGYAWATVIARALQHSFGCSHHRTCWEGCCLCCFVFGARGLRRLPPLTRISS